LLVIISIVRLYISKYLNYYSYYSDQFTQKEQFSSKIVEGMDNSSKTIKDKIMKNLLPILTVLSVISGVFVAFMLRISREEPWTPREVMYIGYIGEVYLRALKALIIPLIVSSIITAIGSLDLSLSKKIGFLAIAYYFITTILAIVLGIVLVLTIQPGSNSYNSDDASAGDGSGKDVYTPDLLMDLPRNLFPPNLFQAAFQTYKTIIIPPDMKQDLSPKYTWKISSQYVNSVNIMGLLMFSAALGVALSKLGEKGKPLVKVFSSLSDASMVITGWLIAVSPVGIFFMVTSMVVEMDDVTAIFGQVGMYALTVLVGIFIHGLVVLPSIYTLMVHKLPFRFLGNMGQALITAFATSTSSGTLPVTMNCLEELNGIDSRVTRFVLPIGATINMDGTALYEAVAAIFIAQVRGLALGIGQIIAISITSAMASMGAAGIPNAGLVTMVMVLDVVGLPAEDVTLIIAVDWLLDRFRTAINVLGDSIGAGIVYALSKKELDKIDQRNQSSENNGLEKITVESTRL